MFSGRALIILGTIFLFASPQIYQLALTIIPVIEKSGVVVPQKSGPYFIIPGKPEVDYESVGPVVKLSVCASNQFRKIANATQAILKHNFPFVDVQVKLYEVPEGRLIATKLIYALQAFLIVTTLIGSGVLSSYGFNQIPWILDYMDRNKIVTIGLVSAISTALTTFIITTGAFEIYCNGRLIFSRLAQESLPELSQIMAKIRTTLPQQ